uniref:Uncharacterized protein n=1 Tax=Ciona savignyi TaxID=51511 RepID=H2YZ33_CIOSA
MSASSLCPRPSSSRLQRRHSSSVPGHPHRLSPAPPSPSRDLQRQPHPKTPKLPVADLKKDVSVAIVKEPPVPSERTVSNNSRRHRSRHHRDSTSHGRNRSW